MKKTVLLLLAGLGLSLLLATPVSALSLKLQPLLYNESLQKGEKKKGFIDVSNPTGQTLRLSTSVQAFRQTNSQGKLEFYDDGRLSAGLIPDLDEFELGPRESLRLYFLLDSTKLPSGDVFGALFVTTTPSKESAGVSGAIKLGTLFTLVNGTPGARQASIEELSVPFFQYSNTIDGSFTIKNTADPSLSSGFFPAVLLRLKPVTTETTVTAPLVFSGISREVSFTLPTNRLGFFQLEARYGDSNKSRWMFLITGFWQWLAPVLTGLLILIIFVFTRYRSHHR